MSPERLNELEQLARAATPGPWTSHQDDDDWLVVCDDEFLTEGSHTPIATCHQVTEDGDGEPDAEFISTFDPPTVLALLSEVRALRESRAAMLAAVVALADSSETQAKDDFVAGWDDALSRVLALFSPSSTAKEPA